MSIERRLLRRAAKAIRTSLVESVITALQRMPAGLSGDDLGLDTAWDEVCVQIQGEQSIFWDAYVQTIDGCIAATLFEISPVLRDVLSAATVSGDDWLDEPDDDGVLPVFEDEIVDMARSDLFARADEYEGDAIQQFKATREEVE